MDNQPGIWDELVGEGRGAFSREDFDLAERRFLDALRVAEEPPGQRRNLDASVALLSFFYCERGMYQEAERYWLRGLELLEQTHGRAAREVGTYLYNMAEWVYRPWGKREEAARLRRRAEVICGEGFFGEVEPPTTSGPATGETS